MVPFFSFSVWASNAACRISPSADPDFAERVDAEFFDVVDSAPGVLEAALPVETVPDFAAGAAGLSDAQLKSCSGSAGDATEGVAVDLALATGFVDTVAGFEVEPDSDAVRSRIRTCFAGAGAEVASSLSEAVAVSSGPFAEKYSVDFEAERAGFAGLAVCRSHSANGLPS